MRNNQIVPYPTWPSSSPFQIGQTPVCRVSSSAVSIAAAVPDRLRLPPRSRPTRSRAYRPAGGIRVLSERALAGSWFRCNSTRNCICSRLHPCRSMALHRCPRRRSPSPRFQARIPCSFSHIPPDRCSFRYYTSGIARTASVPRSGSGKSDTCCSVYQNIECCLLRDRCIHHKYNHPKEK